MSSIINQHKVTGSPLEHTQLVVTSAGQITVDIENTGTDDATHEYIGYGKVATKVVIRTDKAISITKINGNTLKSPLPIAANGSFTWANGFQWSSFELDVQDVTANIDITVQG